jgi:hydroxycarboxylate dehydrogenase B
MTSHGKLELDEARVSVAITDAHEIARRILTRAGCPCTIAGEIVDHLIDADLCGVESHGIFRALQYADEFRRGYIRSDAQPSVDTSKSPTLQVDGQGGIGITAMAQATEVGIETARTHGLTAIAVRNTGHTGRLGAFAETAANAGCLFIASGGGARQNWRMVAPYGGAKAVLPTNPWCLGIPGGDHGPVVLDCATGQIAGGWIYAAQRAGGLLPHGAIIDNKGRPTRDPADYFAGGAILPKGGALGYGLATIGELICDAMLGPAKVECNTFVLMVDTGRYRAPGALQQAAEDILGELRQCPPAAGFSRVEVPGERESAARSAKAMLDLPAKIWAQLRAAAGASGEGQV